MFDGKAATDEVGFLAIRALRPNFRSRNSKRVRQRLLLPIILTVISFALVSCDPQETPESTDVGSDLTAETLATIEKLETVGTETTEALITSEAEIAATSTARQEEQFVQATESAMETVRALQSTSVAEETAVAHETANAEATVNAASTIDAAIQATSTAIFQETKTAYETLKVNQLLEIYAEDPFVLPISGTLALDDVDYPSTFSADVDLHNFVVKSRFVCTGDDANCGKFGFLFRQNSEQALQLTIGWAGDWILQINSGDTKEGIQDGRLSQDFDSHENTLALYVEDAQGFFYLNGEFVADLDLNQLTSEGDIEVLNGHSEISAGIPTPLEFVMGREDGIFSKGWF